MKHLILLLIAASFLSFQGCQTLTQLTHPGEVVVTQAETADQLVLRAEQTAETAKATFDILFHLEKDNRAALLQLNPAIHVFTEKLKKDNYAIGLIQSLRNATKAFKSNRTAGNQANLNTYLLTLNQVLGDANKYIAQAKPVATTSP